VGWELCASSRAQKTAMATKSGANWRTFDGKMQPQTSDQAGLEWDEFSPAYPLQHHMTNSLARKQ